MNTQKMAFLALVTLLIGSTNLSGSDSLTIDMAHDIPSPDLLRDDFKTVAFYCAKRFYENNCPNDKHRAGCIQRLSHGAKHAFTVAKGADFFLNLYHWYGFTKDPEIVVDPIVAKVNTDDREKQLFTIAAFLHDAGRLSDNGKDNPDDSAAVAKQFFLEHEIPEDIAEKYSCIIKKSERDKGNILAVLTDLADQAEVIRTLGLTWWVDPRGGGSRYFDLTKPQIFKDFVDDESATAAGERFYHGYVPFLQKQFDLYRPCPMGEEEVARLEELLRHYNIQRIPTDELRSFRSDHADFFGSVLADRTDITPEDRAFFEKIDRRYSFTERQARELDERGGLSRESFDLFDREFDAFVSSI